MPQSFARVHGRKALRGASAWLLCGTAALALAGCDSLKGPDSPVRSGAIAAPAAQVGGLDLSPKAAANPPAAASAGTQAPPAPYAVFGGSGHGSEVPQAAPGVTAAGKDYNVSFDNAPVAAVVRGVLGNVLKVGYTIDPHVQGNVTLSTGGAVTRDELLKILELALRACDAALVYDKDHFNVVPASAVEGGAAGALDIGMPGRDTPPGYGITVLPLRHVKAETVKTLVEGFAARSGLVRAAVDGNLLLLKGTSEERDSLAGIARSFDVDTMRDQTAAIATLRNGAPGDIIDQLNHLAAVDPQAPDAGMIRFEPLPRLNAVLVVAHDRAQVQEALAWVRRLDQPSAEGPNYFIYKAQNTKAADLAQVLAQTFGDATASSAATPPASPTASTPATPPADTLMGSGSASSSGAGSLGSILPPAPASTSTAPANFSAQLTGDIRITADIGTNSLIIRAPGRVYRQILDILHQIDKPPVQVYINVMIAEITLNDNLQYGVQAYLQKHNFSLMEAAALPLAPSLPGFNYVLGNSTSPSLVLDALSAVTTVHVVSSPSVVTLDNQMATIKVGDQVPITTQQAVGTQVAGAPLVNTIDYRDAGVILRVTPRVSETGLVSMDVSQELSAVVTPPGSTPQDTLTPTISERAITSTIAVYNRQTVVLGGLIATEQTDSKNSIPMVNRIPVLGELLGTTDNKASRTELVVFITPRVIRDAVDASRVSEDVRNALELMNDTPAQR